MAIRNKVKVQKIEDYLAALIKGNKKLRILINNLGLRGLYAETLKETFGEMSPDEMAQFILDNNNAYKLGEWAFRQKEKRPPMESRGFGDDGKKNKIIYGEEH